MIIKREKAYSFLGKAWNWAKKYSEDKFKARTGIEINSRPKQDQTDLSRDEVLEMSGIPKEDYELLENLHEKLYWDTYLGGDGDEYWSFYVSPIKSIKADLDKNKSEIYVARGSAQAGAELWWDRKRNCWSLKLFRYNRSVISPYRLGQGKFTKDLLDDLTEYLADWEENRYWDEESDNDNTINYMKASKKVLQQYPKL